MTNRQFCPILPHFSMMAIIAIFGPVDNSGFYVTQGWQTLGLTGGLGCATIRFMARKPMMKQRTAEFGLDFYATPDWVTEAFLTEIITRYPHWGLVPVWEPACGDGRMAECLDPFFPELYCTDVVDRGYENQKATGDFFLIDPPEQFPDYSIITNPPYCVIERFILRALSLTPRLALLGRLAWLEGAGRYKNIFKHRPPTSVHVFTRRISFLKDGLASEEQDSGFPHAWFVWDTPVPPPPLHPTLHWIDAMPTRDP